MAAVTASAAWPLPDGYTGAVGAYSRPVPGPPAVAWPQPPGVGTDVLVRAASPRQAVSLNPQAARWLFPPQTTVPAASPFTRYPTAP